MERDQNGNVLTAMNHCDQCLRNFETLADEKDSICGNCHNENYRKKEKVDAK